MKLLIGIPSPREIPQFIQAISTIRHDKFWVKYHRSGLAYAMIRRFFLSHKEYTHLAICPDDLIVTPEGVDRLVSDATEYPVVMGTCNVEKDDHPAGRLAMSHNLPSLVRDGRHYDFYQKWEVAELGEGDEQAIIAVPWCGTPFAIIERSVLEKLDFRGDMPYNPGATESFAIDVGLAHQFEKLGIKIMVDTRVYFYHHRVGSDPDFFFAGKKEPYWMYEHNGMREYDPEGLKKGLRKTFAAYMQDRGLSSEPGNAFLESLVNYVLSIKWEPVVNTAAIAEGEEAKG